MITADGYSKDPNLIPEGIVLTWGKDLIVEKGGLLAFVRHFEKSMQTENCLWLQKCKNRPTQDDRLSTVYLIVCGRLQYRCFYGGYESGRTIIHNGNGVSWCSSQVITWPRVILAGPFEKCPFKRQLKGFQGFRYCTKLF